MKDPFRHNSIVTTFSRGIHADSVTLLEGDIIKKSYSKDTKDVFLNEIMILGRLQALPFVPKILWINLKDYYFCMEYCGKALNMRQLKENEAIIHTYIGILKDNYGLYHNDIKPGNVCKKDSQIYLIDFSWANTVPFKVKENRPGYNTVFDYETAKKTQ